MDVEKAKINLETAKIAWAELQRFFAAGKVFLVSKDLDLTEVAMDMSEDDVEKIAQLIEQSRISNVSDGKARELLESEAVVWSVVVMPYVLVQEISVD